VTPETPAAAVTVTLAWVAASGDEWWSGVADWLQEKGPDILTALAIVVAAGIINLIVSRAIKHGVERMVRAGEERRRKRLEEEAASGAAGARVAAGTGGVAGDESGGGCTDGAGGEASSGALSTLQQRARQSLAQIAQTSERGSQRTRTLGSVLRHVASIAIWAVALMMVLAELGVSIGPLLAGAGIIGVALGFGAQSLVRDFLSGIFMLVEDQYGVGDVVDLGEASGVVEQVTLRVTVVRDVEGTVWYVPNGEIRRVGNKSQTWARTILDIEVAYDTEVEHATRVIKDVADSVWRAQAPGATVIAEPEIWGLEQFGPNAIVLRLAVKTKPGEQWAVGREIRARLKEAFDAEGIVIPFPQQTVWYHADDAGAGNPVVGGREGSADDVGDDGDAADEES
jgi:small conductance mechanosensitive channel